MVKFKVVKPKKAEPAKPKKKPIKFKVVKKKEEPKPEKKEKMLFKIGEAVLFKGKPYYITELNNNGKYEMKTILANPYYKSIKKDNAKGGKDIHYKFEGFNFTKGQKSPPGTAGQRGVNPRFLKKVSIDLEKFTRGDRPGALGIPKGKTADQYKITEDEVPSLEKFLKVGKKKEEPKPKVSVEAGTTQKPKKKIAFKVKGAGEKELLYLRTTDSFPLHPNEARDILLKTKFGKEKQIPEGTTKSLLDRKKSTKKDALDNIKKRIKEEEEGFSGKTSMGKKKIINLKRAEQWVKANYNKYIVADPKKVDMKKYTLGNLSVTDRNY